MTAPENRERQRETIEALQQAIDSLNAVVSQLNTGSIEALPPREAIDTLLTATGELTRSLTPAPQYRPIFTPEEDDFAGIEEILTPAFPERDGGSIEDFEEDKGFLGGIFNTIRAILPDFLRDSISDRLLSTVLIGGAVALVIFGIVNFSKNPPEVADNPVETVREDVPRTIETPPELKAPDVPMPVPITKPEPKLTPEQSLVAAIQEEIGALTSRYPEGLISTVEVDFVGGRLTVFVGDSWYGLKPVQQDKFADSIWRRSADLDFRRLEVKDANGTLIARSPVIGDKPVIVARTRGIGNS
jgi:hypothetical protein